MASLFISYSRRDIEVARKLTEAFKLQDLDFWIDWEGIPPTVNWWKEIERGIEEADIFLFLISPDSTHSKVCKQEIEHAVRNGKRLIPLLIRDIKGDEAPDELSSLNWIFLRETDDFELSLGKLMTAIKTDYEWVQAHRQFQLKALEWTRSNHENSFLLRGKELTDAESQLVRNSAKEPYPTILQQDYILKSRRAADRQRRIVLGIAVAGIVALAALAIFGFYKAGEATTQANIASTAEVNAIMEANARATSQAQAEERAKIARAGELSAQSINLRDTQLDLSSLLGLEAYDTWDYLGTRSVLINNLNTNPKLRQYMFQHAGWISDMAFNPITHVLASAGCWEWSKPDCVDGEVVFWSLPDGHLEKTTSLHIQSSTISSLAFNPQGSLLAIGVCTTQEGAHCSEGEIILWNPVTSLQMGIPLKGHTGDVNSLAFSPDGRLLVSGSCASYNLDLCTEGEFILWDVTKHSMLRDPIRGHGSWIGDIVFSPDGRNLATGAGDGTIMLWAVQPGDFTEAPMLLGPADEIITSLAFSPDGNTLVSAGTNDHLELWDTRTGELIRVYTGHENDVYSVAFSPDGNLLASAGLDQSIILWDVQSAGIIDTLGGHSEVVTSLTFTHEGRYLASASADSKVMLWNVGDYSPLGSPIGNEAAGIASLSFDSAGRIMVTTIKDQSILISDLQGNQTFRRSTEDIPASSFTLALSQDQRILAMGGENSIYMWNTVSGEPLFPGPLIGHSGQVNGLAFSSDNRFLASGGCQERDENLVCRSGKIMLWDVAGGQSAGEPIIGHTSWVNGLAFSPDGRKLASASTDGTILLWDLTTRQLIGIPFLGHTGRINDVSFSPDGKMLASAGNDGTIILWDVDTHQPIINPLYRQYTGIQRVAFSPNGESLISVDSNDNIMLWKVAPHAWRAATCQRIGRNFTQQEWAYYFPGEEYSITCPQWPAGK